MEAAIRSIRALLEEHRGHVARLEQALALLEGVAPAAPVPSAPAGKDPAPRKAAAPGAVRGDSLSRLVSAMEGKGAMRPQDAIAASGLSVNTVRQLVSDHPERFAVSGVTNSRRWTLKTTPSDPAAKG